MRFKLIACKVLCREIARICADCENTIDVTFMRQGYHNEPQKLREILQREIDRIDSGDDTHSSDAAAGDFDAILIGYGLCCNGTSGIFSRKYPVVLPRAHDCVTLLLGSAGLYRQIFDECSGGVYWYSSGWMENCPMPCPQTEAALMERYTAKYGRDNAVYLVGKELEKLRQYRRAAFIGTGFHEEEYGSFVKTAADYFGWDYKKYNGDDSLLRDFLAGKWDDERFLKLPPRRCATASYDEKIIKLDKTVLL